MLAIAVASGAKERRCTTICQKYSGRFDTLLAGQLVERAEATTFGTGCRMQTVKNIALSGQEQRAMRKSLRKLQVSGFRVST